MNQHTVIKIRIAIPVAIIVAGIVYYIFDPSEYVAFPKCRFFVLTGLKCPACGLQRAVHALLSGNVVEAFSYNLFLLFSLPYAVALVLGEYYNFGGRFDRLKRFTQSRAMVYAYILLFFIWWVLRNVCGL